MEIKGKILEINETQEVKENFRKREFILEYSENDKYIEYLKFEAIQDKCEMLDSFAPGNEVEVFFNLRGRPWVDKTGKKSYFTSLQAWRIKPADESGNQSGSTRNTLTSNSNPGMRSGVSGMASSNAPGFGGGSNYNSDPVSSNQARDFGAERQTDAGRTSPFPPSDEDDLPF